MLCPSHHHLELCSRNSLRPSKNLFPSLPLQRLVHTDRDLHRGIQVDLSASFLSMARGIHAALGPEVWMLPGLLRKGFRCPRRVLHLVRRKFHMISQLRELLELLWEADSALGNPEVACWWLRWNLGCVSVLQQAQWNMNPSSHKFELVL